MEDFSEGTQGAGAQNNIDKSVASQGAVESADVTQPPLRFELRRRRRKANCLNKKSVPLSMSTFLGHREKDAVGGIRFPLTSSRRRFVSA